MPEQSKLDDGKRWTASLHAYRSIVPNEWSPDIAVALGPKLWPALRREQCHESSLFGGALKPLFSFGHESEADWSPPATHHKGPVVLRIDALSERAAVAQILPSFCWLIVSSRIWLVEGRVLIMLWEVGTCWTVSMQRPSGPFIEGLESLQSWL